MKMGDFNNNDDINKDNNEENDSYDDNDSNKVDVDATTTLMVNAFLVERS